MIWSFVSELLLAVVNDMGKSSAVYDHRLIRYISSVIKNHKYISSIV